MLRVIFGLYDEVRIVGHGLSVDEKPVIGFKCTFRRRLTDGSTRFVELAVDSHAAPFFRF